MLKVFIHSGALEERNPGNQLAMLDIAYAKKSYMADYQCALLAKSHGELNYATPQDEPESHTFVLQYPRWSGSLWDLTARALTRVLYRDDQAPAVKRVDRRCAYATRLCVAIQQATMDNQGLELATGTITQTGQERGSYTVNLEEDILGRHSATFAYGEKTLNPSDLVLRAICWALFNQDTLGRRPALILPPAIKVDGIERFDIENLTEPARTGFNRYRAPAGTAKADAMPLAEDYVRFLTAG